MREEERQVGRSIRVKQAKSRQRKKQQNRLCTRCVPEGEKMIAPLGPLFSKKRPETEHRQGWAAKSAPRKTGAQRSYGGVKRIAKNATIREKYRLPRLPRGGGRGDEKNIDRKKG